MVQNLTLSDLTTVARLGAGAFGLVTLVKHNGSYYALKQLHKSQVVAMGLQVSFLTGMPSHSSADASTTSKLSTGRFGKKRWVLEVTCAAGRSTSSARSR